MCNCAIYVLQLVPGKRDGDWTCDGRSNSNFAWRTERFRCKAAKPNNGRTRGFGRGGDRAPLREFGSLMIIVEVAEEGGDELMEIERTMNGVNKTIMDQSKDLGKTTIPSPVVAVEEVRQSIRKCKRFLWPRLNFIQLSTVVEESWE
jgi:hypothetical protein